MLSAFPVAYSCAFTDAETGRVEMVKEHARLELGVVTIAAPKGADKLTAVEFTIWGESGKRTVLMTADVAEACAISMAQIMAKIFPDRFTTQPHDADEGGEA